MDGRVARAHAIGPDTVVGGRYRMLHERASHADTALWQGLDEVLSRPVAVRLFRLRDDETLTPAQLHAAVGAASRVSDGRFARVLDVGDDRSDDGVLGWVVSEWIDAPSLAAVLRDGPLPAAEAADVVGQVAAALAVAADVGVHHGRLHPGNVLLPGAGVVKITDLQVAAAVTGSVVTGPDAARTDAHALGALLYAALTAAWPDGRIAGLPAAPREGTTPCTPRQVRAGVPRDLDLIASRALGLGPAGSAQPLTTAEDVADALGRVERRPYGMPADPPVGAAAPGAGSRLWGGRMPAVLAWVVPLVIVALVGVVGWVVGSAIGRVPGAENRVPSFTQPTPSGSGTGPALSLVWRSNAPPAIRSFDPEGDGEENPDEAPLAVDGDPSTAWTTDRYQGDPQFGRLKQGVGLVIDLGRPVTVREARLAVGSPGIALQLRAADAPKAAADDFTLVGQATATGTGVTIRPGRPTTARYWLVWVTKLASDNGGYRANIAEIALLG